MKKIRLTKNYEEDNYNYFLLDNKYKDKEDVGSAIEALTGQTNVEFIQEAGVTASNNYFWVLKFEKEGHKLLEVIPFENKDDFEILE